MHPILKNVLALPAGLIIGNVVNMAITMVSGSIIPPPPSADISSIEGLRATMHLFEPRHFVFPFLAHALGTLAGAFTAAKMAASHKLLFAFIIGLFFLAAGTYMVIQLPAPMWFNLTDLILAYLPMAFLGGWMGMRKRDRRP